MAGMNRDTMAIEQFCRKYENYCEEITAKCTQMKTIAQGAAGSLRDEVGQRAVEKVFEFCDKVIAIVYQGEQPIKELQLRNRRMQEDMEELRGRFR